MKERFFQVEETASQLLSDFREVEENFRKLDRRVREQITTSHKTKGELLDEIFGEQDVIHDSDQGKSFRAFWAFLMSPDRQQELSMLVNKVFALAPIKQLEVSDFLAQIRYHLLDAGEKVQRTSSAMVEQLRQYLDDQVWLENKRIMSLIIEIEQNAVKIKQTPPRLKYFTEVDDTRATIDLPMQRSLFRPVQKTEIYLQPKTGEADFNTNALYEQQYVDVVRLQSTLRKALQTREQVSLQQLCEIYPLEQGLSELVTYMNLASQSEKALIDSECHHTIRWKTHHGEYKQAVMPIVIFTR